jgi:hypothetical protein
MEITSAASAAASHENESEEEDDCFRDLPDEVLERLGRRRIFKAYDNLFEALTTPASRTWPEESCWSTERRASLWLRTSTTSSHTGTQ